MLDAAFFTYKWEIRGVAKEAHANAHFGGDLPPASVGAIPQKNWALGPGKSLARDKPQGFFEVFYGEDPYSRKHPAYSWAFLITVIFGSVFVYSLFGSFRACSWSFSTYSWSVSTYSWSFSTYS